MLRGEESGYQGVKLMQRALLSAVLAGALIAPNAAQAATVSVEIAAFQYAPGGWVAADPLNLSGGVGTVETPVLGLTVKRGDRIIFANHDPVPHTVTKLTGSGSWTALRAEGLQSATLTIPSNFALGKYVYRCIIHPGMRGAFTVTT